jgi:uncharacterized protein (DUF362 family)
MKRRDFLTKSLGAGLAAGSLLPLGRVNKSVADAAIVNENGSYDLVAVKGGEPDVMFDKGIASLGGMGRFVKPDQTVVVKPNIGWDAVPERAANTNPALVGRIVKRCFDAGAKDVYVFDHTCDEWTRCYKNSGIEKAVKDAGGKIVTGDSVSYYREVEIPGGKRLKKAMVHELILDSDVVLNVPILKSHSGSSLSIAMKNLMGVVWDRRYWHGNDLHQCIADFATYCKPQLNIVDAYNVMMQNGPRGVSVADVVKKHYLIISPDMVAADTAAAKIFGMEPEDVSHIRIAAEMGIGKMDLNSLSINRITI